MDPFYTGLLTTFGPPALVLVIGIQLLVKLFGYLLGRFTPTPAPVPGVPNSPLIAPSNTPTLLSMAQAWARNHGHPIPLALTEIAADVLAAIHGDLSKVLPAVPPPAPKN